VIARAQIGNLPQTEIEVQLLPENPKPNSTVSVFVNSYAANIDTSKITWKIDGKTIKSGTGDKTFSFKVGNTNTTTTLDIVIETTTGETIEKTYNIKPTSVDLLWESEGFVPPFYKGKSLFSYQNKITITAIPHITDTNGQEISANNMVYNWTKDGSALTGSSGFGKNSFSFVPSIISRPFTIEVNVSTMDSDGVGYASIDLAPSDPIVLFYRKDPLYGIGFQKALLGSVGIGSSREITTVGIPMFFGTTNANSADLVYKWYINGTSINSSPTQSTQVFRQNGDTVGTSNISLSIENDNKILQYATNNFIIMFGNSNNQ
jgi:hypothetical protein